MGRPRCGSRRKQAIPSFSDLRCVRHSNLSSLLRSLTFAAVSGVARRRGECHRGPAPLRLRDCVRRSQSGPEILAVYRLQAGGADARRGHGSPAPAAWRAPYLQLRLKSSAQGAHAGHYSALCERCPVFVTHNFCIASHNATRPPQNAHTATSIDDHLLIEMSAQPVHKREGQRRGSACAHCALQGGRTLPDLVALLLVHPPVEHPLPRRQVGVDLNHVH